MNILFFALGTVAGTCIVKYHYWFYNNVSHLVFVEKYLGSGNGYTGWKLFGIMVIIVSWILAFKLF